MSLPLRGEPRTVFCYVKPGNVKQFETYIKTKFKDFCEIHKSKYLVKKGYFGLGKPSKASFYRIGDYTLIMKENYVHRDKLMNEKINFLRVIMAVSVRKRCLFH